MNRFVAAACLCLAMSLAPAGCKRSQSADGESGGGKRPRVAYVTNGIASFWTVAEAGAKAGGKQFNAEVEVHMPAGGADDQKRIIEDLLTRGVDGIAVSPIDAENQTAFLNQVASRTRLITQDSDAPKSNRLCYIGMLNYDAGRLCGQLVKEAMPEGGTVMIFVGRVEQDNARGRRQGVIDELMGRSRDPSRFDPLDQPIKGDKFTVIGTLTDGFDMSRASALPEETIAKHPDLGCMVGLFAYNPPRCVEAVRRAGKVGKIKVVGFDEEKGTLDAIKAGDCFGTVVQNPYGYGLESVRVLAALTRGDQSVIPAGKFIDMPARQIRKDTVDAFAADLEQKMAAAEHPSTQPATKP